MKHETDTKQNNTFISDKTAWNTYKTGWSLLRSRFWFFVGMGVILFIFQFVGNSFPEFLGENSVNLASFLSLAYGLLIVAPISLGTYWIFLKAVRREEYKLDDIFIVFRSNYRQSVMGIILTSLFIILGLVLLIIPGIIIGLRLFFVPFLLVDKKMLAWDAITTSRQMTKGYGWTLFKMGLIAIGLIIVGFVLLIIGIIPVSAWLGLSAAVLYHSIASESTDTH